MKYQLYLLTTDITLDGGVERVVCNMANSLKTHGFDIHIISIFKSKDKIKYELKNNIKIKYLYPQNSFNQWFSNIRFHNIQLYWRLKLSLKFTNQLYRYINSTLNKENKGIILCNSYLITPFYKPKNISIIGLDHSCYPFGNLRQGLKHWLHTFMVRQFDIITTLNNDEVYKWKTIGRPVIVMPNYIPKEMTNNNVNFPNFIDREKVILSLGRMNTEQKGFDRLIEAYSLIASKYPDWKLKIFGSGSFQGKYKQMITQKGLEKYISIYDYTENPIKEYQQSSIYAMCSREEGFGMVLLEAGINGLPLVAYDVKFGPRAIIKDKKTGFVIPDNNTKAFSEALEKLMTNSIKREQMSKEVSEDIKNRFSENIIIEKWIKLINSL